MEERELPNHPVEDDGRSTITSDSLRSLDIYEEIPPPTKYLSKDELGSSECCRLCAFGIEEGNQKEERGFVSLFSSSVGEEEVALHHKINSYLPIEILDVDPFYPKVICSECLALLERTIEFFEKICEGQRLLGSVLNDMKTEERYSKKKLKYSKSNPLFAVTVGVPGKRGRGRPRKVKTDGEEKEKSPKDDKQKPEAVENVSSFLSDMELVDRPRGKRKCRPPARYIDEILPSLSSMKEDIGEEEKRSSSSNFVHPQPFVSDANIGVPTDDTTTAFINSLQTDFSMEQHSGNLMDLGKLDMLMNDDVVDTVSKMVTELDKTVSDLPSVSTSAAVNFGDQLPSAGLDVIGQDLLEDPHPEYEEEDDEANDKTVQLADLRRAPKRKSPRKRQKSKRNKNTKPPKIPCPQCPKVFHYTSSLVYHRLSVHDKAKNFVCNVCGRGFAHKQLLNNHMYVHLEERFFNCDICPAKFKGRASLYTHKKSRHSAVKEHKCDVCGAQFGLKSSLIGHMRLHTGEKPFACEFCEKKFAQRSSLREHRRTHTGEKPYHCEECPKRFTTASQLRGHKFCHSNHKSHICHICGKGFSHAENFKYHLRRHNFEKPVTCPICQKDFAETWTFKKHFRLHTGERPYKCESCPKMFADPSNFAKHKKIHTNQPRVETVVGAPPDESMQEYLQAGNGVVENLMEAVISTSDIPTTSTSISSNPMMGPENLIPNDASSSIVQILDSNNLTYQTISEEGNEQVIYVYADGPFFTLAMPQDEAHHQPAPEETLCGVDTSANLDIGSLSAGLETFNPNDIESHYYSLETVGDGSTIAVPIQMPLSRLGTSQLQSTK